MASETTIKNRIEQLRIMDAFIHSVNNEELIDSWLTYGVPDEASEDDYRFIAKDDEAYKECVRIFKSTPANLSGNTRIKPLVRQKMRPRMDRRQPWPAKERTYERPVS